MDTIVGGIATSYHETPDETEISDFVTFGIILIYEQVSVCKAEILYFFHVKRETSLQGGKPVLGNIATPIDSYVI